MIVTDRQIDRPTERSQTVTFIDWEIKMALNIDQEITDSDIYWLTYEALWWRWYQTYFNTTELACSGRTWWDDITGCRGNTAGTDDLQAVANGNAVQQTTKFRLTRIWHNLIGWWPVTRVTWPADNHQVQNAWRVT